MEFGDILKQLREEKGITQAELATRVSWSPSSIEMYEQNRRDPDKDTLMKISDIFNVSIDYLLGKTSIWAPIETVVASHNSEEWTAEELMAIEDFKAFVKSRRGM